MHPLDWRLFSLLAAALVSTAAEAGSCEARSGTNVVPLVELYTSEGCSDCPPADAWLSKLATRADPGEVTALALHVDYWDAIGWIDPFADPTHGQRQDFRVKLAKKKVIYTPHVMIGTETTVKWSEQAEAARILARARSKAAQVDLAMEVARTGDGLQVAVSASPQAGRATTATPDLMWLALYQDGLVREIGEGENKGRTLRHDRVVRALEGPWGVSEQPVSGRIDIPLEPGADLAQYGLVLFAESSTTGAGLQSLGLPLQSCAL